MSLIALRVKNRFSLYFGSVLFSCLNCLVLFHLIQWVFNIFPVEFVINMDIYLGIILFSLYIPGLTIESFADFKAAMS